VRSDALGVREEQEKGRGGISINEIREARNEK
jgi:hypothetical protein